MFGKSNDNEIVEMKTGSLNTFYVDCITEKRKKTNKLNASHDIMVTIQSDASEEEFKQLYHDFITDNGEFQRWKFQLYLSKNGFYSFSSVHAVQQAFPYQEF